MKTPALVLSIPCTRYDICRSLVDMLTARGFHAHTCSPYAHAWEVRVTSSESTVNLGATMFDELKTALLLAEVFIATQEDITE